MVLAPEHPLVAQLTTPDQAAAVADYQTRARAKSDLERTDLSRDKTGAFTGGYAINPVNGEKVPIWIADYVLISYGTGAIMAVPAHDERDHAFAQKFGLPIRQVVRPKDGRAVEAGAGLHRRGRRPQLRHPGRPAHARGQAEDHRRARAQGPGQGAPSATSCATGCSPGSATGASPSPSSTAKNAAARCRSPTRSCLSPCPRSSATSPPERASRRWRRSSPGSQPPARAVAARPGARRTRCPSGPGPAGTTCATSTRRTARRPGRRRPRSSG